MAKCKCRNRNESEQKCRKEEGKHYKIIQQSPREKHFPFLPATGRERGARKRAVAVEAEVDPEIKTKEAMEAVLTKVEPRKDRTKRQPQAAARKEARNNNGSNIKAH
ncbi:uncharacterized protein LOC108111797 isoform X1 [Drosophila eugracilis]|uniref:uncharacterized protein LOC108111797 isoform X1 n=1 Tax=Drosophila eugracilis TaxID=29029 RepID=UPI001BDA60DD|nr:uncharacterized protein LOC108111797 isoform X1 [Drosophila eugracilis]